jgi:hypothetical protein
MPTKINWKNLFIQVVLWVLLAVTLKNPTEATSNISKWTDYLLSKVCNNALEACVKYPDFFKLPAIDWVIIIAVIAVLARVYWKPLSSQFKRRFFRILWDESNFLGIFTQKHSIGTSEDIMIYSDLEIRICQFFLQGRNQSKKPIDKVSGKIVSAKTNNNLPILLDGMKPEETYGIPGRCDFQISAIFPRSTNDKEGYTIEDFWRHFGEFDFIFEYDGKKYVRHFSEKEVKNFLNKKTKELVERSNFKQKPRVKKR